MGKPCSICKKDIRFLGGYVDGRKRYCPDCWRKKEGVVRGEKEREWNCIYCGKNYPNKEECTKHIVKCRDEKIPFNQGLFAGYTHMTRKEIKEIQKQRTKDWKPLWWILLIGFGLYLLWQIIQILSLGGFLK